MLLSDEFTLGALADAAPLTLMLPRSRYERHFLVGGAADSPIAICLAQDHKFRAFHCVGNDAHKGILIPNVRIEVDPTSAVDDSRFDVALGTVVRRGKELGIMVMVDDDGFRGHSAQFVALYSGLNPAREGYSVGFRRWSVTLGSGDNHRTLFELDLSQPIDPAAASS